MDTSLHVPHHSHKFHGSRLLSRYQRSCLLRAIKKAGDFQAASRRCRQHCHGQLPAAKHRSMWNHLGGMDEEEMYTFNNDHMILHSLTCPLPWLIYK